MIVGLGGKGVSEVGITLHHTWGVPVLPGSSLKGIAALGARRFLEGWEGRPHPDAVRAEGPTPYDALFGDVEEQGAVVFHDAWMVPTPDDKNPIHRDVMTVHHPDYYQDGEEPADTESPIPVPFVSASGSWLVALELAPGLDPEAHGAWLEAAWTALRLGLDRHGIGSKTNAGYGRFDLRVWGETGAGRAQTERERRAAELREEARRVFEMEQTRARRLSLVTPMDRVMDVLRSEGEGAALLRRWIATGGAAEVAGLPTDQDHVVATVRALFDAHRAEGLKAAAPEGWRTWVAEGLTTPAIVAPRRALREGELDVLVKRHTRRGKIEYHKMVTSLHRARLDVAGLQIAIERLRQLGASSGHLRSLVVDLESAATEE
ncbi:MAG: type III-B CRISPR module RAMP protein Cmr6 [Alphaproteobacteria bacterium]|nr:type III-B CRISPR module RAMP protein Cmr6 [Alphaproteobacteria bacterium]